MKSNLTYATLIAALALGASTTHAQTQRESSPTSSRKPVIITRFYTGADRRSHADQSEAQFGADNVLKLPVLAGEFHWMLQSMSRAPHTATQRMYVITLSGTGEISLTDGKKYSVGPGTVDIVEDTTGLGHLTHNINDRLTVWLPLADSSQAARDKNQNAQSLSPAPTSSPAGEPAFKPVTMTRLYTGPDGLGHAEEVQAPVDSDGAIKLDITGAELHWQLPSATADWHRGPRRQYVITLSGTGEVEVAGGQKIPVGPGNIDLIEDTTGKGHITRNFTDRLTLWLPLADQTPSH